MRCMSMGRSPTLGDGGGDGDGDRGDGDGDGDGDASRGGANGNLLGLKLTNSYYRYHHR